MKRILIPIDFSPNARKALQFAAAIAERAKAVLIIVNVFDVVDTPFREKTELEKKHNVTAALALQEELALTKKELEETRHLDVVTQFYAGAVTSSIIRSVEDSKADMIVMGTLGNAAIKERLFGSVTAAVIAKADIPVLAVPLLSEWDIPRNILLAINHFDADPQFAKPVVEMASLFGANLIVATFTNERKAGAVDYLESTRGILAFTENLRHTFQKDKLYSVKLYGNQFEEALDGYFRENNTDILAMFTYKRSFISSLFNRSMTKKMSYQTDIPLLVIPVK